MRLFRSQHLGTHIRSTVIFLALVLGYFLLRAVPPVGKIFRSAEHGLVVVGTSAGNMMSRVLTSPESTAAQLATCTERLQTVTARESTLRQDLRDVTELEQLLGYVRTNSISAVAARITNRTLPEAGTVTIDRGTVSGIVRGNAVVVGDGQLFGTVIATSENTATVRLVQERASKVPAAIIGTTRTIGLVEGQSGSVLHMEYIPSDATIAEGDVVVTSGLDGGLPPNIVIGLVTSIVHNDTAPFLEALIEPLYDPREWTNVLVRTL